MSIKNILVPQLSESTSKATVLEWKKNENDFCEENDIITSIETDKVVLEIFSPVSGILKNIIKKEESVVNSGEIIAKIEEINKANITKYEKNKNFFDSFENKILKNQKKKIIVSPKSNDYINNNKLNPYLINNFTKNKIHEEKDLNKSLTAKKIDEHKIKSVFIQKETRKPMSRLRINIANRLVKSKIENATLTTFNEVNMKSIICLKKKYKEIFEKKYGTKLGLNSFFIKSTVAALKNYPILNSSIINKDIVFHNYFDICIAVSSDKGLLVPVIRNADKLSIYEIENKIIEITKKAKENTLKINEISGGTFTISNGGVFGSMFSTPIINPPQSSILGIHSIKDRPIVENGNIVIRPMTYLALSYDHRIIDGKDAILCLKNIKENLEDPHRLILEI